MWEFLSSVWSWVVSAFTPTNILLMAFICVLIALFRFVHKAGTGALNRADTNTNAIVEKIEANHAILKQHDDKFEFLKQSDEAIIKRLDTIEENHKEHKLMCNGRFNNLAEKYSSLEVSEPKKNGKEKGRILVVDDEPNITLMLRNHLEAKGHHVTTVNRYSDAVDSISNDHFEWVLSDVVLKDSSGHDGYALWELLHRKFRETKCILFTGFKTNSLPDYVQKNISDFIIVEKINLCDNIDREMKTS